jgi:hypothetical protein
MIAIDSAQRATDIAVDFFKKYRPIVLPISARREGDVWVVTVDVGVFLVKPATVLIEASTGKIKEYNIPA